MKFGVVGIVFIDVDVRKFLFGLVLYLGSLLLEVLDEIEFGVFLRVFE